MSSMVELAVEQRRREHSQRRVARLGDAAGMLPKEEASERRASGQPLSQRCHSRHTAGTYIIKISPSPYKP